MAGVAVASEQPHAPDKLGEMMGLALDERAGLDHVLPVDVRLHRHFADMAGFQAQRGERLADVVDRGERHGAQRLEAVGAQEQPLRAVEVALHLPFGFGIAADQIGGDGERRSEQMQIRALVERHVRAGHQQDDQSRQRADDPCRHAPEAQRDPDRAQQHRLDMDPAAELADKPGNRPAQPDHDQCLAQARRHCQPGPAVPCPYSQSSGGAIIHMPSRSPIQ